VLAREFKLASSTESFTVTRSEWGRAVTLAAPKNAHRSPILKSAPQEAPPAFPGSSKLRTAQPTKNEEILHLR
jgi:hypothetical protein